MVEVSAMSRVLNTVPQVVSGRTLAAGVAWKPAASVEPLMGHARKWMAASAGQCLLFAVCAAVSVAAPGQYNTVLDIGDTAPQWRALPGTDGAKHSSDELADKKAVVVVFTCNSCPYAVDIEDRLINLHQAFADRGVAIVAINVNKIEEDRLPAMKEKAETRKFAFAYLFDETQDIARAFGAKYTPEFFVLDAQRRIRYMGSLDDSPDGRDVAKTYVSDAVESVLAGDEITIRETVPVGCRIRFERTRRKRKQK
ncbi:MAG: thioredoxin family protein [Planctomycetota bacterium]